MMVNETQWKAIEDAHKSENVQKTIKLVQAYRDAYKDKHASHKVISFGSLKNIKTTIAHPVIEFLESTFKNH